MKRLAPARLRLLFPAVAATLAMPAAALACGACIEDKVAATYDHAVIERAKSRHHLVVFTSVQGKVDGATLARLARQAALRAPGVDVESIRTAADPTAMSFALDPRLATPGAAVASIARAASRNGVGVATIRVVP